MSTATQIAVLSARMNALEMFTVQIAANMIAAHDQRADFEDELIRLAKDERINALQKSYSDLAQRTLDAVRKHPTPTQSAEGPIDTATES